MDSSLLSFLTLVYGVSFILGIILMIFAIRLLITLNRYFQTKQAALKAELDQKSPGKRLLELEKRARRQTITPEEYAAKRQEILNDL